ncbi:hypothetical protein B566_EDAN017462 [Ephemera danica]|nr:hypothetical protein B566_EDAN017462 [Ephemera danica]
MISAAASLAPGVDAPKMGGSSFVCEVCQEASQVRSAPTTPARIVIVALTRRMEGSIECIPFAFWLAWPLHLLHHRQLPPGFQQVPSLAGGLVRDPTLLASWRRLSLMV